jgi:hypothetical protein
VPFQGSGWVSKTTLLGVVVVGAAGAVVVGELPDEELWGALAGFVPMARNLAIIWWS